MGPKKFLRRSFRAFLSLAGLAWIFPGFQVKNIFLSLIIAALIFTAINILVKPILKLIFLPLNLVSFGMLRWVVNVFTLLILTLIVEEVRFVAFKYPGFDYAGFVIPALAFSSIGSLIAGSFILNFIRKAIYWLLASDD